MRRCATGGNASSSGYKARRRRHPVHFTAQLSPSPNEQPLAVILNRCVLGVPSPRFGRERLARARAAFFRRAMQSLGARRQPMLVPVARRTQPRAHETRRGRERRVGVGQILRNVLPDDRDRSSTSARLERARPRGFPEPASRRNGGLSALHHDRRDSCSSWRAHARAAPSCAPRDPTRPTSARLSHPMKSRATATALASTRLGSLGPPRLARLGKASRRDPRPVLYSFFEPRETARG